MEQIPGLNRSAIQANTSGGSFKRGKRYYEEEAIRQLEQRDGEIRAQVQGTEVLPYRVHITYDRAGLQEVTCSCPYHRGSWCKHIAAVLLSVVDRAQASGASSVKALLAGATREELVELVEHLAERDARILDWIEEKRSSAR